MAEPALGPVAGPVPAPVPAPGPGAVAAEVPGPGTVDWIGLYLMEDVATGDVTSDALFGPDEAGAACIVAQAAGVAAGLRHAVEVFARLGCRAVAVPAVADGVRVAAGQVLQEVRGPARAILAGERLALNIVARMSGIATQARACQDRLAAAGSKARVAATRKTTPGFRAFEKEAVVLGGGEAHRAGLWDEAMLKDNHLEAWTRSPLATASPAQVGQAVAQVVQANRGRVVCCEAESLDHAVAAAQAGASWVLIDNQAPATGKAWAAQLRRRFPALRIEASGGIRPDNVAEFGWADRVSLGWITQKVAALDVGMEWIQGAPLAGKGKGDGARQAAGRGRR